MRDFEELVLDIVALNGGQMVGKTRLQKTVCLLEAAGLGVGIDFDYHHYGPYSSEISDGAEDAIASGLLDSDEHSGRYGVPYTIYSTTNAAPNGLGKFTAEEAQEKLAILGRYSALELEVAATIDYLQRTGYGDNAISETQTRKPSKATAERIERAQELLRELGIS